MKTNMFVFSCFALALFFGLTVSTPAQEGGGAPPQSSAGPQGGHGAGNGAMDANLDADPGHQ